MISFRHLSLSQTPLPPIAISSFLSFHLSPFLLLFSSSPPIYLYFLCCLFPPTTMSSHFIPLLPCAPFLRCVSSLFPVLTSVSPFLYSIHALQSFTYLAFLHSHSPLYNRIIFALTHFLPFNSDSFFITFVPSGVNSESVDYKGWREMDRGK